MSINPILSRLPGTPYSIWEGGCPTHLTSEILRYFTRNFTHMYHGGTTGNILGNFFCDVIQKMATSLLIFSQKIWPKFFIYFFVLKTIKIDF